MHDTAYELDPLCNSFCLFDTGDFCYSDTDFNYGCYNMVKDAEACIESKARRQDKYDAINKEGCVCEEINSPGEENSPSGQKPSSECTPEMSAEDCENLKEECEAKTPCPMNISVKYKTVANVSVAGCAVGTSLCYAGDLLSTLAFASTQGLGENIYNVCARFTDV